MDPVDGATVGVSYRVVAPISLSAFSPHAIPGGGGSACCRCSSGAVLARSSAIAAASSASSFPGIPVCERTWSMWIPCTPCLRRALRSVALISLMREACSAIFGGFALALLGYADSTAPGLLRPEAEFAALSSYGPMARRACVLVFHTLASSGWGRASRGAPL